MIDQISEDAYDPHQFEDTEKKRILAAIDAKIAVNHIVASAHNEEPSTGQVIDLMEALRASLGKKGGAAKAAIKAAPVEMLQSKERKGVKRASKTPEVEETATAKTRARK